MVGGLVVSATGPMIFLADLDSIRDPRLAGKFYLRGIKKFMAYEVPVETLKRIYEKQIKSLRLQSRYNPWDDGLWIIDIDGPRIFTRLKLADLGDPYIHEPW